MACVEAVVAFQLVGDGLAQCGRARNGRIVRVVAVDGVDTGLLGRFGCVEVGFADAQADDVDALGFQFTAFVGHGQRCRLSHVQNSVGKDDFTHDLCYVCDCLS